MGEKVGIRELRQNLSVYVRRVRDGERFVVTERNQPVARLEPLADEDDHWQRLIDEGVLTPAAGRLADLPSPQPADSGDRNAVSKALEEAREERLP